MTLYKVCSINEISTNKPKKFSINNEDILIAKSNDGQYFAFSNTCSHADKPLEKGNWNPQTCEITCPFHKAVFDVAHHGAVKAPPAFVNLPVFPLEIKDNFIFVNMD